MADIDAGCFLYSAEQNFMGLRCRPDQHSEPQCSCLEPNSAMIFLFKDIQSTNMTRVLRASNALDQIWMIHDDTSHDPEAVARARLATEPENTEHGTDKK